MSTLETLRQNSLKTYQDLPEPNSKDPAWRFATTRNYRLEDPSPKLAVEEAILHQLHQRTKDFIPETSAHITLVANNQLAALEKANSALHVELTDEILKPAPTLGGEKFQALNIAYSDKTLEIDIPVNTVIEQPILITH